MKTILIVDDDIQLRTSFENLLLEEGYAVSVAPDGETCIEMVKQNFPDLVVMDVRMPGMSGLETYKKLKELYPRIIVIIMTAFGTTETAIEATKLGAFDYILKPFEIPAILSLISQALEVSRMAQTRVAIGAETASEGSQDVIVGSSKPMQELYKAIGRVAPTDATVLVLGESGTGKELVSRAIFQHSERADRPFLVINCVAIPETLLESELFGYEKGAFTGAGARKIGKIEQADGGTVFLDEIGDMPLSIQTKILRLLQEQSIERLGGSNPIKVNVRIIAATNRNLESLLSEGRFREDLYYRLKVVTLQLPSLRERREDIELLCDFFMSGYAAEMGIDNPGMTKEVRSMVKDYNWPGNVRELANLMRKALIFSRGYPIRPEDLTQAMTESTSSQAAGGQDMDTTVRSWARKKLASGDGADVFSTAIDHFSAILISEALSITGGNRSHAAKLLGMSRPTLLSKIEKYGLTIMTSVKSDND